MDKASFVRQMYGRVGVEDHQLTSAVRRPTAASVSLAELETGVADLAAVVRSLDDASDPFADVELPTRRQFLDPSFTAKCPLCEKSFSTYQGFMRHVDHHRGRFAFFCSVCGRGFMTKDHLGNHVRGHTGERLYCQCGVGFKTHQALRMHRKRERHDQNSIRYDDRWLNWNVDTSSANAT